MRASWVPLMSRNLFEEPVTQDPGSINPADSIRNLGQPNERKGAMLRKSLFTVLTIALASMPGPHDGQQVIGPIPPADAPQHGGALGQDGIERKTAMSLAEDATITQRPVGLFRVIPQDLVVEDAKDLHE